MRSASRLVIVALLGVFLALPAVSALSALPASAQPVVRAVDVDVDDEGAVVTTTAPSTVQPGPGKLTPDTEADKAESKRKLVMGVASVVLVGMVIWGRSIRRKRKKATEGG
jgi:predicted S18 family serine protease